MATVGQIVLWNNTGETEVTEATGSGVVRAAAGVIDYGHPAVLPWSSGSYYDAGSAIPMSAPTAGAMTALRLFAVPQYVPNDITISEVGINVTTGAASAVARLGIYDVGADFKPGALRWEGASTLDVSTTGEKTFTGLSIVLPGGRWYYTAVVIDLTGVSMHEATTPNTTPLGYTSHSSTTRNGMQFKTLTSPIVLPNPFGTPTGTIGGYKRVTLRVA